MNTTTRGKHLISRTVNVVALIATAWISLNCCTVSAQAPQPGPTLKTERQTTPQVSPDLAQALAQLARRIEGLEHDLTQMRKSFGAEAPRVAYIEKELAKLRELQSRFSRITPRGESNESSNAETSRLVDEILAATAFKPPTASPEPNADQLAAMYQQLQQMKEQLAEREKQMKMMAQQLPSRQTHRDLPALEGAQAKGYTLRYVPAREAAQTIESLIGTSTVRLAVDERNNSLIIYGKADSLGALETLLAQIDRQASPQVAGEKPKQDPAASPRSLMLRLFWLADGVPKTVGQNPADFLPKSVLAATQKLGLEAPRLVTQTVNSLATGKDDAVDFSTNVPALLFDQPVGMGCKGKLKLVADDRVRVDMGVHVGGQTMNCELGGSMTAPLGHYVVLGTANSMIAEGGSMAGRMPGSPGTGMEIGGFMSEDGLDQPIGGFRRGVRPGTAGAFPGGVGPEGEFGRGMDSAAAPGVSVAGPTQAKPKFATSRFAFVVQVIEGQSYEAEKAKSDGE